MSRNLCHRDNSWAILRASKLTLRTLINLLGPSETDGRVMLDCE